MTQTLTDKIRWTTADLELLPDNDNRYEIIGGAFVLSLACRPR